MDEENVLLGVENFFTVAEVPFSDLFEDIDYVWEALTKRNTYIRDKISPNIVRLQTRNVYVKGDVHVGEGTVIEPGVCIKGPTIIGNNCEIRHGAYIRGNVIVGHNSVVGHATEVIRSIILNNVRADHFAYIGDSILGNNCHLGAGVILANVKMRTKTSPVSIRVNGKSYDTRMRKLGAILGDNTEMGCNSTANPGTILAKGVTVYPGITLSGYYPPETVVTASTRMGRPLPLVHSESAKAPATEQIMCPNCGAQIASIRRVQELIAYCKEFFGQCNCGQKYHIVLSFTGGAVISFPDRQIETYLQFPDKKHSPLGRLPH